MQQQQNTMTVKVVITKYLVQTWAHMAKINVTEFSIKLLQLTSYFFFFCQKANNSETDQICLRVVFKEQHCCSILLKRWFYLNTSDKSSVSHIKKYLKKLLCCYFIYIYMCDNQKTIRNTTMCQRLSPGLFSSLHADTLYCILQLRLLCRYKPAWRKLII